MSEEAWQSVENHDQSIENMTKGRHEETSLFFLERLQNNPCQKQDLWHEHGITFWILKQPWSSSTYWNFWPKCKTDKWEFHQIQDVLKQFTIFEAFWPLCGPEEQGNQFLISQKHPMGSYYQGPMGDHHCMHDPSKWYVDYRIHNIEAVQTLEFSLGWENYLDYNNILSLYEKWH